MNVLKIFSILALLVVSNYHLNAQKNNTIASAEITFVYLSNTTDGRISGFSSSSTLDLANPENSLFKGEVKTKTLKTGNFLRDWSLKGSKYFDADTYPIISFSSSAVSATEEGYTVKGDLTIKKTTKSITIQFLRKGTKLIGTTTLYSSDFGINIKESREDNKVSVKMIFELK